MDALEREIRALVAAVGAGAVAVVAAPVERPHEGLRVDADRPFHAASTMKVPVLLELYRQAAAGSVELDGTLIVRNRFASIADGSEYVLDRADDSEAGLYARIGEAVSVRELARLMIVVSSNLATNLLVDLLGPAEIRTFMRDLGAPGLVVLRGVEDGPAFERGLDNAVTAGGLAVVFGALARGEAVSVSGSAEMLGILADQAFNDGIPAGLPPGTRVAHKTGSITGLYHDAGVVWPDVGRPYVLVVLTTGLDEHTAGPALVAAISRLVRAQTGGAGA